VIAVVSISRVQWKTLFSQSWTELSAIQSGPKNKRLYFSYIFCNCALV